MKIAITGGSGFLGKYVTDYVQKELGSPIVLTRTIENNFTKESVEHRLTNYTKNNLIEKLQDIDALVHLAATRGNHNEISEFHSNEVLTQNLYEACRELKINNIVYASSISVYSDLKKLPWKESQPAVPKNMYGISKLTCEHIGNIYSSISDINVKNLRFAHLYGFNEKNNYMINSFFRQAFNKKKLILECESIAKREFLYAKDAAKAIICSLKENEISGTFNIGSEEYLSNYDVAIAINKIFGNEGNIVEHKEIEKIQSSYMESTYAQKILNYKPDYNFSSAICEIFNLMKELEDVPLKY